MVNDYIMDDFDTTVETNNNQVNENTQNNIAQ